MKLLTLPSYSQWNRSHRPLTLTMQPLSQNLGGREITWVNVMLFVGIVIVIIVERVAVSV